MSETLYVVVVGGNGDDDPAPLSVHGPFGDIGDAMDWAGLSARFRWRVVPLKVVPRGTTGAPPPPEPS